MDEKIKLKRIKLIEKNLSCFLANWKDLEGVEFVEDTTKTQLVTGMPFAFLNSIVNVDFSNNTEGQLSKAIRLFKESKVPVLWWIGPSSKPIDLDVHLEKLNFTKIDEPPGMYIKLKDLNLTDMKKTDLMVELVQTTEQLEDWVKVFVEGIGVPEDRREDLHKAETSMLEKKDYLRFVGYSDGEPVTISALILEEDVVGVYFVITRPEYRGKGYGTVITVEALEEAHKRGYSQAILQSSAMGYNIYKRIGFEEYCKFKWYFRKFE